MTEAKKLLTTYGIAALIALLVAVFLRHTLVESFRVPTTVMKPTLLPGDLIFVTKYDYGWPIPWSDSKFPASWKPNFGDVVVYQSDAGGAFYVKRVVAASGDEVAIEGGQLIVNGNPLPFVPGQSENCGIEKNPRAEYPICIEPPQLVRLDPLKIPENHLFVIGDFRTKTPERPSWEVIPDVSVIGRARWIWISIDKTPGSPTDGPFPMFRTNRFFRRIR